MRVLTVYYKHRPGGMMQMIYRMLRGGAERGWSMHYVSVARFEIAHPRIARHRLPWPGRHDSLAFWAWFFLIAPIVSAWVARRERVDLYAVFEGSYAWVMRLAQRVWPRPMVVFLQSDVATINRLHRRPAVVRRLEQMMECAGLRAAHRIIATNRTLADIVTARWALPTAKIQVVPNTVRLPPLSRPKARAALRAEHGVPTDAFVIATSGVFSPRKNLAVLLAAFAELDAARAHLVVIGESPDAKEWQRATQAARAGRNGERVHFLGWRNDVPCVLAGCDLFVFPSRHEGSPLSLIEALRVGVPCLGSDIPEIREVLGACADLFFPPDRVDVLRVRLQRALDDRDFYQRLCTLTDNRVAHYDFDWEVRVTEILRTTAATAR